MPWTLINSNWVDSIKSNIPTVGQTAAVATTVHRLPSKYAIHRLMMQSHAHSTLILKKFVALRNAIYSRCFKINSRECEANANPVSILSSMRKNRFSMKELFIDVVCTKTQSPFAFVQVCVCVCGMRMYVRSCGFSVRLVSFVSSMLLSLAFLFTNLPSCKCGFLVGNESAIFNKLHFALRLWNERKRNTCQTGLFWQFINSSVEFSHSQLK